MFDDLREEIAGRRARAGVIGLGYVGLPLLVELAMRQNTGRLYPTRSASARRRVTARAYPALGRRR